MNAKGEVFIWKKKASLIAQIDNVFDRTYSDLLGASMPQRWWMLGAKINL
jgi:iron complex outermembrane receptor protein